MWHWQLLPRDVNLLTLGLSFARAALLPSLRDLVTHCVPSHVNTTTCLDAVMTVAQRERNCGTRLREKSPVQTGEEPQARRPDRIRRDRRLGVPSLTTMYGNGLGVLWLGQEMFMYVDDGPDGLTGWRLPREHLEVPSWVVRAVAESTGADLYTIRRHVDRYLELFGHRPVSAGHRLLRRINWAAIPLVWQPLFFPETRRTHSVAESEEAQLRLLQQLAGDVLVRRRHGTGSNRRFLRGPECPAGSVGGPAAHHDHTRVGRSRRSRRHPRQQSADAEDHGNRGWPTVTPTTTRVPRQPCPPTTRSSWSDTPGARAGAPSWSRCTRGAGTASRPRGQGRTGARPGAARPCACLLPRARLFVGQAVQVWVRPEFAAEMRTVPNYREADIVWEPETGRPEHGPVCRATGVSGSGARRFTAINQ
jgi:hypothetical protein